MILILLADGALGWTLRVLAPSGTAEGQSYRYQVLTPFTKAVVDGRTTVFWPSSSE
jgi:hypothetical protein